MMLALVLIVATDSPPAPVLAVPRSLAEYALEHRGLLRGTGPEPGGGVRRFSVAATSIPRDPYVFVPAFEEEPEPEPPEPAVGAVPPAYGPVWVAQGGGRRQTRGRVHRRPSAAPAHQARTPGLGRTARR